MIDRFKGSLPGRVAIKFNQDRAANWAVQIAWSSLLAFFPITLIAVAVLGYLLNLAGQRGDEIRLSISAVFPDPDAQKQVHDPNNASILRYQAEIDRKKKFIEEQRVKRRPFYEAQLRDKTKNDGKAQLAAAVSSVISGAL